MQNCILPVTLCVTEYCRIISPDNNNSVKFTSSREDNFTTNDSMVIKDAHEQLHNYVHKHNV